ncbi:hypothetical protein QTL95_25785 [Rhizobium sp. S152]|uniref:hypothetical protein n=1 Tax=Rhizobium sp. S152 TaxID=3055038 RepID=UPI0025A95478|nr:hypothetical protein [Rhizobium sp. S152]MDM9629307.1 hypothetical protein [Rhizobium sp. S152]
MAFYRRALFALALSGWAIGAAHAGSAEDAILPASILFATSTGYWEDDGGAPAVQHAPQANETGGLEKASAAPTAIKTAPRHGYYKLFAVRQADRTAKIYLQQIAQNEDGPSILSTVEVQEINDLKPYVTDIRPESSGGMIKEPGLFAMVHLKTDPDADSESWTVIIDEFGEVSVDKAGH